MKKCSSEMHQFELTDPVQSPEKKTLYLKGLYPEVYVFHGFGVKSLKPKSRPFDFVATIMS